MVLKRRSEKTLLAIKTTTLHSLLKCLVGGIIVMRNHCFLNEKLRSLLNENLQKRKHPVEKSFFPACEFIFFCYFTTAALLLRRVTGEILCPSCPLSMRTEPGTIFPPPKNNHTMKDYYKILGVSKTTGEEEIRKKYRKLAMQYHPDRNPDDPAAEEKFKEIAEAYGVLTDPVKRREYEACKASGKIYTNGQPGGGDGFTYSQEDILRDLFKDPRFQQMFSGILREFQRSGFRYSSQFVRKSFFSGKKGIFVGGIFLIGSLAKPLLTGIAKKGLSEKSSMLKSVGNAVGSMLGMGKSKRAENPRKKGPTRPHLPDNDTTYHTPLTERELRLGKAIQVLVYGEEGEQTLKVKIPPGSRAGQKLRIRGKGRPGPHGRGDLYLHLAKKES